MRPFTARRLALAALIPALLVLSVIPGCSNESEGERCGDSTGVSNNDDCGAGLTCTSFPLNDGTGDSIGRCCYTDHHVTDSRCLMSSGVNAFGSAGSSGTAGSSAGGSATAGAGQAGATTELAGAGGA